MSSRVGTSCAAGDLSVRAGTFDAVGDGNPVPERVGCPRLERTAPGRAKCPCYCEKRGGEGMFELYSKNERASLQSEQI